LALDRVTFPFVTEIGELNMKHTRLLVGAALGLSFIALSACTVDEQYRQTAEARAANIDGAAEREGWVCEYVPEAGSNLPRKVCGPADEKGRSRADAQQGHRETVNQSRHPGPFGN
jgi:hypothetical protein